MGSALGSLVVKLALEYAEYTQGLGKADQEAKKFAKGVQDTFDSAQRKTSDFFGGLIKGAAGAVAAYLSVGAALGSFNKAIDDMSGLKDVAESIGSTGESVSRLAGPLALTGKSMNDLTGIGTKLAKAMSDAGDSGSEAAKAFKSIGVNPRQFNDTTDALIAVAKGFENIEDGSKKSALAMQLLGKSGAETIPLLKEIAGAGELHVTRTNEQIEAADRFSKQLAALRFEFDELAKTVASAIVPKLTNLIEQFKAGTEAAGGFWNAIFRYGFMASPGTSPAEQIAGITKEINRLNEAIAREQATANAPAGAVFGRGARNRAVENVGRLREELAQLLKDLKYFELLDRQSMDASVNAAMNALGGTGPSGKSSGGGDGGVDKARQSEIEAAKKAYTGLIEKIQERIAVTGLEIVVQRDLTESERHAMTTRNEMAKLLQKVAGLDSKRVDALLDELDALTDIRNALKGEEAARKKATEASKAADEAQVKKVGSLDEELRRLRESNAVIGLNDEALRALTRTKLDQAVVDAEWAVINARNIGQREDQIAVLEEELRVRKAIRDETLEGWRKRDIEDAADALKIRVKEAESEWKRASESIANSLTDALMRGFESGKGFLRNLVDTAKNLFQTLVLRPIIQFGVQGALSAAGLSAIAGPSYGSQGLNMAGNALTLYNNMGTVGSALNYAGTMSGITSLSTAGYAVAVPGLTSMGAGSQAAMLAAQTAGFGAEGVALTAASGSYATGAVAGSGAMSALAAAAPYIAAVVALVALLARGGETRYGGQYGLRDGRAYLIEGPSGGDPAAEATMQAIEGTQESIYALARSLGGTGGGQITRAGFEQSKYHYRRFTELYVDGVGRRQYGETTDFSNEAVAQQFSDDLTRALLLGLQGAQLDRPFAEYFAQFDDVFAMTAEQVSNAIDTANAAKAMADSVKLLGGVFSQFNGISVEARMRIAELTGGMEAFTQKVGGYVQNYYTEQEQLAIAASQISSALRDANVNGDWLSSREQFRWLVDSLNLSSGVGPEQLAGLLNVADSFASIADQLAESGMTLGEAAAGVPESVARLLDQTSANEVVAQRNQDSALAFESSANLFSAATTNFAARMDSVAERFERVTEEMRVASLGAEVSG